MILTKDLIEKGKSVNNGWSTAQMKVLCEDCHSVEHNRDLTVKKFS